MKNATRAEHRHLDRVAALGCIACELLHMGASPAHVHHIREGRQARSHMLTIPLCQPHHLGTSASVHMAKPVLMRQLGVESEFDLLAIVLEKLA